MLLEDAVALRIEQLCIERNITKYELSERSGVPQTTLSSIKKKRSTSVKLKTLYAICEGFDISFEEFFACSLFDSNAAFFTVLYGFSFFKLRFVWVLWVLSGGERGLCPVRLFGTSPEVRVRFN